MPTTTERLLQTAQTLPEPLLAEVLDFAEFLRARHGRAADAAAQPAADVWWVGRFGGVCRRSA